MLSSEEVSFTAERQKSLKIRNCSSGIKGSRHHQLQSFRPNAFNPSQRLQHNRAYSDYQESGAFFRSRSLPPSPTFSSESGVFGIANPAPTFIQSRHLLFDHGAFPLFRRYHFILLPLDPAPSFGSGFSRLSQIYSGAIGSSDAI